MPELSPAQKDLARGLFQAGIFLTKEQSPGGKGFRMKLHEAQPDAPLSPYFIDLRQLRGYPELMLAVANVFQEMAWGLKFDLWADVPISISPVAGALTVLSRKPMVTPRKPKERGTQVSVEGPFKPGQKVVVVDDLITAAGSKIEAIETLRGVGLIVEHVLVVIDRQQGGVEQLAALGVTLHSAFNVLDLLALYLAEGLISQALYDEITAYIAANS